MKALNNKYIIALLSGAIAGCTLTSCFLYFHYKNKVEFANKYSTLQECENFLKSQKYKLASNSSIINGVVSGYMKSNGDDYAYYTNMSEDDKLFQLVNFSSPMLSTGYQVYTNGNGYLKIVYVTPQSEAALKGLKKDDIIKEINGKDVKDAGIKNIVEKLLGKAGTTLKLKIERDNETFDVELTRKNDIDTSSVKSKMLNDDIAYLNIVGFTELTDVDFSSASEKLSGNYSGLVLDLRQNGGGTIDSVMSVASHFIKSGSVVEHHNNGDNKNFNVIPAAKTYNKKLVVLIDDETASGAEVLTALLKQNYKDVTIVGKKSFGKGIYQLEHTLTNGGVLHYTAGYYTVGDWDCYQGKGITPDVQVDMDSSLIGTDNDTQLQKAIELLNNK